MPIPLNRSSEFNPVHSHLDGGFLILKEYNVTIVYEEMFQAMPHCITDIVKKYRLESNDIFIYNTGLHYHSSAEYENVVLRDIRHEIKDLFGVKGNKQ